MRSKNEYIKQTDLDENKRTVCILISAIDIVVNIYIFFLCFSIGKSMTGY